MKWLIHFVLFFAQTRSKIVLSFKDNMYQSAETNFTTVSQIDFKLTFFRQNSHKKDKNI